MRVVIAEDAAMMREGLVRLLTDRGFEVCAAVADADALRSAVAATGRTWRSSTSGCRRPTPTRGCGPRSTSGATIPASVCWSSRSTWRPATRPACSPTGRPASATCSRTESPTSPTSWTR